MVEYYSVCVHMYMFETHHTSQVQVEFDTREEAEQFALEVDLHRHSTTISEQIKNIEAEMDGYFVNEHPVVLRKHTTEELTKYEGI